MNFGLGCSLYNIISKVLSVKLRNVKEIGLVALKKIKWKHEAKVKWLKEEDNNTKFFQRMANARKSVNFISKMKIGNEWVEDKGAY